MSGYVSVIAGRAKGKRLKVPTGQSVRPTASRARTKLFARVEHHIRRADGRYGWPDIAVLDAFAGSGILGLEAWSRGANTVFWFDKNVEQARSLQSQLGNYGTVYQTDALRPPRCHGQPMGLVFLDPPFAMTAYHTALTALDKVGWLGPKTLVVTESPEFSLLQLEGWTDINRFTVAASDFALWKHP